jgi:RNA polymerase sigma-70 factor (ECF subfamily)
VHAKPWGTDDALVARLRSGDETAFAALVDHLHARLLALAATFTASRALAEDIVQETWLAVIRGLHGFEGRSSLSTWIFSILVRRARSMAVREARRAAPVRPAGDADAGEEWEPGRGRVGLWDQKPVPWALEDPAAIQQSHEALEVVLARDVEDVPARDVCNILDLSETNLRVLLHRGRARVRRALDRYVREGEAPPSRRGVGGVAARSGLGEGP